jgi:hypothetical protein
MCGECDVSGFRFIGFKANVVLLGERIAIYLKGWLDYYLWLGLQYHLKKLMM